MTSPDTRDPFAVEAACRARELDVEGIPMVLALEDLSGAGGSQGPQGPQPGPAGPPEPTLSAGAELADLLAQYRAVLRPSADEDDYWAVHDVLAAISYLRAPFPPLPPGPAAPRSSTGEEAAPRLAGLPTFGRHERALRAGRLLHVVNYHLTPADREQRLEEELRGYAARFDPVTPDHLDQYFATGQWPLARPGFVAAFYDGYREHADVAAAVCDRLGITAWFLPPTGLVDAAVADQGDFLAQHDFWPPRSPHPDGRIALTWPELRNLARTHVLAAHTSTHARPENLTTADDRERELGEPRARLGRLAGSFPSVTVWGGGLPFRPGVTAFEAIPAAGYRYLLSATMLQRLTS